MALVAVSVTISRAGASTLAELAATRAPTLLIPFPQAADNHQYYNARAFVDAGAALLLEQRGATAEQLVGLITKIWQDQSLQVSLRERLERWHAPHAADLIADKILNLVKLVQPRAEPDSHRGSEGSISERAQMARV
jgi:UDP-N-acetylglucosamine--N-acetylmuramyl-(pentapeptide) pyrophosphoryl-undecaprenol N-acetylglucosamine transferase